MLVTNVKELKARLNRYLRFAEQGKVVLVTRRGRAIAEMHPPPRHGRKRSAQEVLVALAQEGIVDLPTRTGEVGLHPRIKVRHPKEALEILDGLIRERKRR